MMNKTILANVGNRHIQLDGRNLAECLKTGKKGFLEKTEEIYRDFDRFKEGLSIVILDKILEEHGSNAHIHLFATDQRKVKAKKEEHRIDQDTIYAAKILSRLIENRFGADCQVHVYEDAITDSNKVLKWYWQWFKDNASALSTADVLLCDVGGTYQQKFALKISAEFLLEETSLEVMYVSQTSAGSEVQFANPRVYRQVIQKEQVRILVSRDEFFAASAILGGQKNLKPLRTFLHFLACRSGRISLKALEYGQEILKAGKETKDNGGYSDKVVEIVESYCDKLPLGRRAWVKVLGKKALFELCEVLSVAQRKLHIGDYNEFVMSLSQFIELYCYAVIEKNIGYLLYSDFRKGTRGVDTGLKEKFPDIHKEFAAENDGPIRKTLPLWIRLSMEVEDPQNQKLLAYFKELNSQYMVRGKKNSTALDSRRNKLAHEGLWVQEKDVEDYLAIFDSIVQLMGLPDENIYTELEGEVLSLC